MPRKPPKPHTGEDQPVTIYALCDPDTFTVRYVGKTINLRKRMEAHFSPNARAITPISRWNRSLKSAGKKPHCMILETVVGNWAERERYWIAYYRNQQPDLLNVCDGGEFPHCKAENWGPFPAYRWATQFAARVKDKELGSLLRKKCVEARRHGIDGMRHFDDYLRAAIYEAAPFATVRPRLQN